MKISRLFTKSGKSVYQLFDYTLRSSVLRNPDGSVVFEMHDIEVPSHWSQMATDILAQKYFRKAGVPQFDADGNPLFNENGEPLLGAEKSARQVVHRLAGCWRHWGETHGYFNSEEDAQAFYDEMAYMLLKQMASPNSPQWFNTGLNYAYGITGPAQGHYYVDPETGKLTKSKDAYTHPQPHACARGNTKLFTTEGVMEIQEIVDNQRDDLSVFDGERYARLLAVKNNGVRKIWRATLKNGNYIEFTDDHLVWSADKRVKDGGAYVWNELGTILGLKVQQVALPYRSSESGVEIEELVAANGEAEYSEAFNLRSFLNREGIRFEEDDASFNQADAAASPLSLDVAKAALAGWIVGDGYYGKYNRNNKTTLFGAITINDDEYAYVTSLFTTIFGSYKVVLRKEVNDLYRIVKLDSKVVDSFVQEYDLAMGSRRAKVADRIFKGTQEEKIAFLRSLFQADGCVRIREERNSGDVVLSTISDELAHDVQVLLLSLGIYSNVSVGHDSRQDRHPLYHVSISWHSERSKFEQLINFVSEEKREKLHRLNGVIDGKNKGQVSEETVISIDYIGQETVYDIQTESARFAANGVVVHNCFIQSVSDDLVNEGGIFDLVTREARIFKYGSGTGSNFSALRGGGEPLSGGGVSSGLMSFLKINDRAAGAVKSGGTTRRAAKMVILNVDHPDIEQFIDWKMVEEQKVAALVAGSRICRTFLGEIADVAREQGTDYSDPGSELHSLVQRSLSRGIPFNYIVRVLSLVDQGVEHIDFREYDLHYEGEAYNTVSGQNSNNSIRITNDFVKAIREDQDWNLTWRTNGKVARTVKARYLWGKINYAAWSCADPGLQYDTTINEWHTSPKEGRINASNPCSEFLYLDDTACNLASLNLDHFYNDETGVFDVESFKHASRLWAVVLEISVLMAQFPSKEIAQKSFDTRTLGLGYANLGTVLMTAGIPYDSDEGRAWAAAITAIMCGEAYAASAEMAGDLGPFNKYQRNAKDMLRVMRNHRRAAYNAPEGEYEGLTVTPVGIDEDICPENLVAAARECWDRALALGEQHGYRNAQVTVIAPTGTISLVMDCDTTGIEPDFALVKYKKLAGGGYFKIVNQSVPRALRKLGYTDAEIADITAYIKGYASLQGCPHINRASLKAKGFTDDKVDTIESQLSAVFDVTFAFNRHTLGDDFLKSLGFNENDLSDPGFNLLKRLGFTDVQIEEANRHVCGTMTIEGAPGLNEEHLPVFDCANKCGKLGKRFIDYMGHVKMMAAAQPFISGAISKTINMPAHATVGEVEHVYMESWKLMLKAIAIYRDGSKLSQPLNVSSDLELVEEVTLRDIDVEAGMMIGDGANFNEQVGPQHVQEKIVEKVYHRTDRRRLPKRRHGFVREATVGGHKVFLRTGEYEDGAIGEIFIDMYKEGASFKGLLNCFAVLASKALQYGMPLEKMVDTFTFTRFEPSGPVQGHEAIKNATSIIDYVFRAIGYEYLGREDFVHIKAVDETEGIEYGPGEGGTGETVTGKLSPGRELWERQQSRKKESNGGAAPANGANGTGGAKKGGTAVLTQSARGTSEVEAKVATAKAHGYTGEQCGNCGSMRVKQNGACHVCEECGTTSGCS